MCISIFFLLNLFLYVRFLMARASHNHNFFGFLGIFWFPRDFWLFLYLQVPTAPYSLSLISKHFKMKNPTLFFKKILPSHCCPATCQKWRSYNFSMHSCTLHVLYFLVLVLKQMIHNTSIMYVNNTVYLSTREGSNLFSCVQFIVRLDWFFLLHILLPIKITN